MPTIAWLALYYGAIWMVVLNWPPWGDEQHYLDTVRFFARGLSVDRLRSYPIELTAPLAFILYSQWSHIVGAELWQVRLLSSLLAIATAALYDVSLRRTCDQRGRRIGLICILANPYIVGLSAFVFTDMLALCFLSLLLWGAATHRPWTVILGLAGATTTRQFFMFLAPAIALASTESLRGGFSRLWQWRAGIGTGLVPLAFLTILWGGHLTPANTARATYLGQAWIFDLHALSLYLAMPGIYLAPLVVSVLRRRPSRSAWFAGLLVSSIVWFWPIRAAAVQLAEGAHTVGFAHRFAVTFLPPFGARLLFGLAAASWLVAFVDSVQRWWLVRGQKPASDRLFSLCAAGAVCFLFVMPFSHMPWEKYGVPLLILIGALFAIGVGLPEQQSRDA